MRKKREEKKKGKKETKKGKKVETGVLLFVKKML